MASSQNKSLAFLWSLIKGGGTVIQELNKQGLSYAREKNWAEAVKCLESAIVADPSNPISYNNLGSVFYRQSQIDEALIQFEKAVQLYPNYADAHANLGHCYVLQEKTELAVAHYQISLQLNPDNLSAQHNLGMLFVQQKNFIEAEPLLCYSYQKDPNSETLFHLALIYAGLGRLSEAITCYERILYSRPVGARHDSPDQKHEDCDDGESIEQDPNYEHSAHNLATLYLQEKNVEKAYYYYQCAFKINPNNMTAKHMMDALGGEQVAQAPRVYVESLFDQYAESYNTHVKGVLNYHVPQHIRRLLTPFTEKLPEQSLGLDLGCGTGLMAPYLQDIIGKLIGVDVSYEMLRVAEQQGGYDTLIHNDIVEALKDFEAQVHLIVAADVFVYLGQLEPVFEACLRALKKNGLFSFSIELSVGARHDSPDAQLQSSGRFTHSVDYIKTLSQDAGFILLASELCILREDEGAPVNGMVFVLENITE